MSILTLQKVSFRYNPSSDFVLEDINFSFEEGKMYAIVGKSGAGKTTLLSLLSGLARPTSGQILYKEKDLKKVDPYWYRSHEVGIIFQSYNLLPHLTALENVMLSMNIAGDHSKGKKDAAVSLLEKVGIDKLKAQERILHLSGGEQQRVAITRALSFGPSILLADEPTGNLDSETQDEIVGIFKSLAHQEGKCIILVTHSSEVAKAADKIYPLSK